MAGIDDLKKRILKDDEDVAKQTQDEARSKAEQILREAEDKAKAMLKETESRALKGGSDRKDRIISRAKLEARNSKLLAKQDTIDKILELAEQRVDHMEKEEYSPFIEQLLLNSVDTGEEEVIFSEADKPRIDMDMITRVNEALVSRNKKGMLKLSNETRNIKSGFVLKQGGVEINCSIDSQIRMLRDSLEGELANLLFEGR